MASWTDPRLSVAWCAPPADLPVPRIAGRIPPLTFARLCVPELVPRACTRAIVLDADQLVLRDLGRLAAEPLGDALVLAPRDPFIPCVSSPNGLQRFEELGLAPSAPYFTGAMMVVNVDGWRRELVSERALRYVADHASQLRTYDQDALNAVLAGRFRELDARWQVQPRALSLSARVTPHLDAAGARPPGSRPVDRALQRATEAMALRGTNARSIPCIATSCSGRPSAIIARRRDARALLFRIYDGRLRRWLYPLELRADSALRSLRRRRAGRRQMTARASTQSASVPASAGAAGAPEAPDRAAPPRRAPPCPLRSSPRRCRCSRRRSGAVPKARCARPAGRTAWRGPGCCSGAGRCGRSSGGCRARPGTP